MRAVPAPRVDVHARLCSRDAPRRAIAAVVAHVRHVRPQQLGQGVDRRSARTETCLGLACMREARRSGRKAEQLVYLYGARLRPQ